jgi:predicted transcriptional regulator
MERPTVKNIIKDDRKNITFVILAYRKLTKEEMVDTVRSLWSQKKPPKILPGQEVVIETIYGHDQPDLQ